MSNIYPEIIGIGSTVYDTLMVVDRYPTEDTKLEDLETKVQGGGPCATALVAAQKLGVSAAFWSPAVRSIWSGWRRCCLRNTEAASSAGLRSRPRSS